MNVQKQLEEISALAPGVLFQFFLSHQGNFGFLFVSPRSHDILGIEANTSLFLDQLQERVHPDDRESLTASFQRCRTQFGSWFFEGRLFRHDSTGHSTLIWIRGLANPSWDEDQKLVYSGIILDVTVDQSRSLSIKASERKYRLLFENMTSGFALHRIICDEQKKPVDYRYLEVNPAFEHLTGVPAASLVGKTLLEVMPNTESYWIEMFGKVALTGEPLSYENYSRELGKWFDTYVFSPEPGHFAVMFNDISDRKRVEQALRLAEVAFESHLGMVVTDPDGLILRVNKAFELLTGDRADAVTGVHILDIIHAEETRQLAEEQWNKSRQHGFWQGELNLFMAEGLLAPVWVTMTAVHDDQHVVIYYVMTFIDMRERKQAEEKIKDLAYVDQLTRLPNRTMLLEKLQQYMLLSQTHGDYSALMYIDLDNFKTLNDSQGHAKGDALLRQVAVRLLGCVRACDTVARVGGDEFVVILTELHEQEPLAKVTAGHLAEKILMVLGEPFDLDGTYFIASASIGITLFNRGMLTLEDLQRQADLAMYRVKETGKRSYSFFEPNMEMRLRERLRLETDLRMAIDRKEFELFYQAQLDAMGRVTGAEALIRWRHPQRGLVPPGLFIPIAEETGHIAPIGAWVLEEACRQLAIWQKGDLAHLVLAINISARQFRDVSFVEAVIEQLNRHQIGASHLKLEVTESMLIEDVAEVADKLDQLRQVGIGFSLDDFGTGYSSLTYLRRLPLDQLKIDQSFVRDIFNDEHDAVIIRTIIALAQSLDLGTLAEGVEEESQYHFLKSEGCGGFQGYYFHRPAPCSDFESFCRSSMQLRSLS